jgi:hypothetical protein
MPFYSVTAGTDPHLVKAKTPASAIRHVVNGTVTAKLLNNEEIVAAMQAGAQVEDATIEPPPPDAE